MLISVKHLVESLQVIFFNVEIYLINKSSFHGLLANWNF